ncbi:uncharacterized protein FOMMEDRAFT_157080 [Fomitiporia mediterranea MF3/22]|uniref:uncharacterized protein n=1 Tax=Fomitiporia mediterranea (strain MF3/22) TaxID=694068 RepID=UPI0004407F9F|nr:uncharacterized protein FOMMEDRAFT_157080 [Fomitiporia mediterranea MF3/22]EJD01940.1 hypothetical protein FOMMEDRAFT_157080 [Fomitiporia mediterranea MF3/22]
MTSAAVAAQQWSLPLEAKLASLPPTEKLQNSSGSESDSPVKVMAGTPGSSSYLTTSGASEADLRSKNGQCEEAGLPSDVECYDVGPTQRAAQSGVSPNANIRTS